MLRTEAIRAARRVSAEAVTEARDRLERTALITFSVALFHQAAELDPAVLRSLDALHLAAALSMGDDLDGVATYDARMADAAHALGLATIAPIDA
jgi:hypothetical protein